MFAHSFAARTSLVRRAAIASLLTAAGLIALKFWAYRQTSSESVLASLLDSVLDASASLVNLVAVLHAASPADRTHRFGHGRAEALAGLAQAVFIAASAVILIWHAVTNFGTTQILAAPAVGIGVMVVAILATIGLTLFQKRVIAKTQSTAIAADELHYTGDLFLNGSVIVALLLAGPLDLPFLDGIFAALIAGWIFWNAAKIARAAAEELMDRELPGPERQAIRAAALGVAGVAGVHDLRTRRSGQRIFVEIHVEMDGALTLTAAHVIADSVMHAVWRQFPHAEVLVHQDPVGVPEVRQEFEN